MRIRPILTPLNAVRFRTSLSTKTLSEAKPGRQMGRWESVVLFALASLATLLIWSSDPLCSWACQGGLLLLAAIISLRGYGHTIDYKMLLPLGAIALWGFVQLALGATVYRYATLATALKLASYGAIAFSAAAVLSLPQRREAWLRWFTMFSVGIGLV